MTRAGPALAGIKCLSSTVTRFLTSQLPLGAPSRTSPSSAGNSPASGVPGKRAISRCKHCWASGPWPSQSTCPRRGAEKRQISGSCRSLQLQASRPAQQSSTSSKAWLAACASATLGRTSRLSTARTSVRRMSCESVAPDLCSCTGLNSGPRKRASLTAKKRRRASAGGPTRSAAASSFWKSTRKLRRWSSSSDSASSTMLMDATCPAEKMTKSRITASRETSSRAVKKKTKSLSIGTSAR
mmetsp:Transcript_30552/g.87653  ORF Transcript_30552/g.87653 Transcript_30552/m.87653 type:complete len:241 (+) Transcript_30552:763-1485(+)